QGRIDAAPVDQHQQLVGGLVAVEAARADRIVDRIDPLHVQVRGQPQRLRQAARPRAPDVVRADHEDGRRRVGQGLGPARHRGHLDHGQLFQRQPRQVLVARTAAQLPRRGDRRFLRRRRLPGLRRGGQNHENRHGGSLPELTHPPLPRRSAASGRNAFPPIRLPKRKPFPPVTTPANAAGRSRAGIPPARPLGQLGPGFSSFQIVDRPKKGRARLRTRPLLCQLLEPAELPDQKSIPPMPPPMPPMSGAPPAEAFLGASATAASVVIMMPATEAASCRAVRTTLAGSMTPMATRSPYSSVWALKPNDLSAFSSTLPTTIEPSTPAFSEI